MKKLALFAAIMCMATSSQAVKLQEGTQSLDLAGNWNFESAGGSSITMRGGYGYFFMDYLEVGGQLQFSRDDNNTFFALGPKVEYNFDLDIPVVIPFVGAALMYQQSKFPITTTVVDVTTGQTTTINDSDQQRAMVLSIFGGPKFFLSDNLAISADLVLSVATADIYPHKSGGGVNTDAHFELGLRYYF